MDTVTTSLNNAKELLQLIVNECNEKIYLNRQLLQEAIRKEKGFSEKHYKFD